MSSTRPRATLASVAQAAGVSTATVSKVLNGRDDVSEATRAAVRKLLAEHQYTAAPRRRPSTHRTIGLVFDDFMSPYATELIRGVTDAGTDAGADVVVGRFSGIRSEGGDDGAWVKRLVDAGRDGVLIVTSDLTTQQADGFERARLPLVVVDPVHAPQARTASVGATNWAGGLSAAEHLLSLGHRRIAYLGGPVRAAVDQARFHGFRAGMDAAGAPVDPELVLHGDFSFEHGLQGARRLLRLPSPPTAVFAVTDVTAMGVIQAAHELGVAVPARLSVVGFDDTYMAPWSTPALTTIRTPLQDMGRVALKTLLRLVNGEQLDSHHIELATSLVVRTSTSAPRRTPEEGRP